MKTTNIQTVKKNKIKLSKENLAFDIVTYIVLGAFLVMVAYPLYFILIASISDPYLVMTGEVLWFPKELTFSGYQMLFARSDIWQGYAYTIAYTGVGTLINLTLTMAVAYPLSRSYFSGRNVLMFIFMFTMYFSGGLIPEFLLVKNLGLRDTFAVMVILGAISVYNVIITRSFLMANIGNELEEAAMIDGCNQLRFFVQMVIPLSKAILSVLVLYYGVAHWNDYMRGLIYLSDADKFPLQLVIRSILITATSDVTDASTLESMQEQIKLAESIKYGVIVVSSLPLLIVYPFLQKYFEKGVMIGSVKG
ncbi:MAG: carbohydrate ABC transporter permease [Lachnospiraceae bacterium]